RGYRSPKHTGVLPSTVKIIRLRHRLFLKRSQSHPRRIPGQLTVSQVAGALGITPHWIYDRIHNGTIPVTPNPELHLYLFPGLPRSPANAYPVPAASGRQATEVAFLGRASTCVVEGHAQPRPDVWPVPGLRDRRAVSPGDRPEPREADVREEGSGRDGLHAAR